MNKYELHIGDANTLVCQSFSDCYPALNKYILKDGIKTESRLGPTYETLNFKTVITEPIKRCTIALNRNSNVFFHLAESIWVLSGRNDLEFIKIFNSKFPDFSDDGKILHGGYGKRIREWQTSNGTLDQLKQITSLLNSDPDLRRSVISLWNPTLDLGNASKDIPCNTQLILRVKSNDFYLTIFNRSNDLHLGYVANIFQFSFLGEIISLLINKRFAKQTHFSQSLHIYTENNLIRKVEESDIPQKFYSKYAPSNFTFNFENLTDTFDKRFFEIDYLIKEIVCIVLNFHKSERTEVDIELAAIESFKIKSKSIYEISFLLLLYVGYRKQVKNEKANEIRMAFADKLISKNQSEQFIHQDYFALALNYFVHRIDTKSKAKYTSLDTLMGQY